ncbi:hypothetical protein LRS13_16555 [Svornostia abyssi]|uniref:Uncharacterized protein n=1 Tax=Svornostia abyssi TaxID=2898438 RepID=A0ABY5PCE5_9ACTN|nr:hypothetical protein LRS13_16555 [Parviterribacteraceae bacterium J379]
MPEIPTQRIGVRVDRVVSGAVSGSDIVVFQTGGQRSDGVRVLAEGDPPFAVGAKQMLFLAPRGDGTYLHFGPAGRFEIDTRRTLRPPPDPAHGGDPVDLPPAVAQRVDGRGTDDLGVTVKELTR